MPRNQNTAAQRARAAARDGAKYTKALRTEQVGPSAAAAGPGGTLAERLAEDAATIRERAEVAYATDDRIDGRESWDHAAAGRVYDDHAATLDDLLTRQGDALAAAVAETLASWRWQVSLKRGDTSGQELAKADAYCRDISLIELSLAGRRGTRTHMRLTVGHEPARALCDSGISAGLVTDPADVTCRTCREDTYRMIAEQERERWQAAMEDGD
jgi:hypothetical protein